MDAILADASVGISELKANPNAVLEEADGMPIAILNRNKPVAYLLPAEAWEAICDALEDLELKRVAEERRNDGKAPIRVTPDDL